MSDVKDVAHAQGPDVKLGGQQASNTDFIDAVYGNFPLMIGLIALFTFLLLARAFRSLLLPAKAVVLNVISVAAAWGVMTLIWQEGHGSEAIWGIPATGAISSWIPLIVFAFLFGLSMDYEVFILARMREEYDATGETNTAVVRGIGRTGRLVTSAALILFLAFLSLASGPDTDVKVLATGLAAGILLDATVIRALLVPAVVSLFGRWNWVLPRTRGTRAAGRALAPAGDGTHRLSPVRAATRGASLAPGSLRRMRKLGPLIALGAATVRAPVGRSTGPACRRPTCSRRCSWGWRWRCCCRGRVEPASARLRRRPGGHRRGAWSFRALVGAHGTRRIRGCR